ncbi:MAG TPA: T9SS type A sorting domain-containing protein, partial [Chryseosolibacter sp.]|nr:T9SS type A sorting domain-containing protein [Chryseosolibacter sp.]
TVTALSTQLTSFESTNLREDRSLALSAFPNPVNGSVLTIESSIPSTSVVRIQVVDMFGQLIVDENLGTLEAGRLRYVIELPDLRQGAYVVRVLSADTSRSAVVVKR